VRLIDDEDLSFCLTVSDGVELGELLHVMGADEVLPVRQTFDDFAWETHQIGSTGLINVFEDDGLLVTLENNGFMGVQRKTLLHMAEVTKSIGHYIALYKSAGNGGHYRYVEVQDGMILANFDPMEGEVPEIVEEFFGTDESMVRKMVKALEYRMEMQSSPEWFTDPADTYVIDYRRGDVGEEEGSHQLPMEA